MPKHTKTSRETVAEFREREKKTRVLRVLLSVVCIVVAFSVGFFVRGNTAFMEKLGVDVATNKVQNPGMTLSGNTADSLSARIAEVEGIINGASLNSYDLESTTQTMLDNLATATQDKYFRYYSPQRYQAYIKETASTTTNYGIGVLLGEHNGSAYAVDVFEGSPAQAAGVRQGDFVVAIDGDKSQKWTEAEATRALSSDENKTVWVTWRRPTSLDAEGGQEFTTELKSSRISEENVTATLDETVGHVSIKQLTKNASNLVTESIKNLEGQGAEAFVLDLRNCPGGYLTQAVDIANLFLKSGTVVQIATNSGISTKTVTNNVVTNKPIVVLVNENTASAAEVIAAALQKTGNIQVVGQKTMGKGSVQSTQALTFGGAVRYTVAYYLTPNGQSIDETGVTPNMSVENKHDIDLQYQFAKGSVS